MMDCNFPDCQTCTYADCMMNWAQIRKNLQKRQRAAGIRCCRCPAALILNERNGKRIACLVHRKIVNAKHNWGGCPGWCTAGIEYVDQRIRDAGDINRKLDRIKIMID